MISRWCAGEPVPWTFWEAGTDRPGVEHLVSPHDMCRFQRFKGHDEPSHRECCWGPEETESRDCTCSCHLTESGEWFEEDEPVAEVQAAFEAGAKGLTKPPADKSWLKFECAICGGAVVYSDFDSHFNSHTWWERRLWPFTSWWSRRRK